MIKFTFANLGSSRIQVYRIPPRASRSQEHGGIASDMQGESRKDLGAAYALQPLKNGDCCPPTFSPKRNVGWQQRSDLDRVMIE